MKVIVFQFNLLLFQFINKNFGGYKFLEHNVIIFSPHPDDETLGCGGTIAKKVKEGYQVKIVFMTDGRNAFSKILKINSCPSPH